MDKAQPGCSKTMALYLGRVNVGRRGVLRHSSFPKRYLTVLYLAMGGAPFLASFHCFYHFWRIAFLKEPCLYEDKYR